MNRVLIWDYTGDSPNWCKIYLDKDVEVIQTITPQGTSPEILLQKNSWDWLLIFEQGLRDFFNVTIKILNLPTNKVIYALNINSWLQHPKAIYNLLNNSEVGEISRRWYTFNSYCKLSNFVTCTVEDISYVATSADNTIMPDMFVRRANWASQDIKRFHELAKKYYDVDDSAGYFLDLGANIGTTGIYFTSKLAPNLKLLAFEPDPENYKLHRINIILNDLEEKTDLVNCGLGDKSDEMTMYRDLINPGGNSIIQHRKDLIAETIKIMPLDDYLSENKIAAQDVKYIWIDTEGFEPQVLLGAKNLLRENPAPVFMECNLRAWDELGCFEDMLALLMENYSHFVHFYKGETTYPLDALRTMERPNNPFGQMGDIFLIRKGAI